VPLQQEYHRRVVSWAISELRAGRTPSPDLFCNQRVKFGAFFEHLQQQGSAIDRVASGHYARLVRSANGIELRRAADPVKDQTYFLSQMSRQQLERCEFPLGDYQKQQVRQLAAELELPNRDRPDSQGICFLGKIPFDDFVRSYLGEQHGEIRDRRSGQRLGEHRGHWFHTIGQRKGLGLSGGPWYVVDKDITSNCLWVAHGEHLKEYRRDRFRLLAPSWLAAVPALGHRLQVKVRHTPRAADCRLAKTVDGELEVLLDQPDPGIAVGQSAALYDGQLCLGGGQIGSSSSAAADASP